MIALGVAKGHQDRTRQVASLGSDTDARWDDFVMSAGGRHAQTVAWA